jgi:hypothetical protein
MVKCSCFGGFELARFLLKGLARRAARMVTLKRQHGSKTNQHKRSDQMELMIGAAGAMTMMVVSLAFQRASYKRVKVTVQK